MCTPTHTDDIFSRPPQESVPMSAALPLARAFSVRLEFDPPVGDGDFLVDLSGNPAHGLFDFLPQITTNAEGRTEIELTVPGTDLWTSILTAMTVVRQSGFDPAAVHGTIPARPPNGRLAA